MKITSNGTGLTVEFDEHELIGLKNVLLDYAAIQPVPTIPRWLWQLDAAIVAKQCDNRRSRELLWSSQSE